MLCVLRIKDLAFEVDTRTSEFFAYVPQEPPGHPSPGRLRWSFEVRCVDGDHERGLGAPYLYANGLTLDVRDWRTIEGRTVRTGAASDLKHTCMSGWIIRLPTTRSVSCRGEGTCSRSSGNV